MRNNKTYHLTPSPLPFCWTFISKAVWLHREGAVPALLPERKSIWNTSSFSGPGGGVAYPMGGCGEGRGASLTLRGLSPGGMHSGPSQSNCELMGGPPPSVGDPLVGQSWLWLSGQFYQLQDEGLRSPSGRMMPLIISLTKRIIFVSCCPIPPLSQVRKKGVLFNVTPATPISRSTGTYKELGSFPGTEAVKKAKTWSLSWATCSLGLWNSILLLLIVNSVLSHSSFDLFRCYHSVL